MHWADENFEEFWIYFYSHNGIDKRFTAKRQALLFYVSSPTMWQI